MSIIKTNEYAYTTCTVFFDYCNIQLKKSHGEHIKEKAKITKSNQFRNPNEKKTTNIWLYGNHGPPDIPEVGSGACEK